MSKAWTWKNVEFEAGFADSIAQRFEVELYAAVLEEDPENVDILLEIGHLYSRMGRLRDGLAIDRRLVEIRPDEPIFHYNLACSHSLLGHVEPALRSLERAIELGYDNVEGLERDADLENLRNDSRFRELLRQLERARKQA